MVFVNLFGIDFCFWDVVLLLLLIFLWYIWMDKWGYGFLFVFDGFYLIDDLVGDVV